MPKTLPVVTELQAKIDLLNSLHLNSADRGNLEHWEERTAFSWFLGGTPFHIQHHLGPNPGKQIYRIPEGIAHLMYVATQELYLTPDSTLEEFANRLDSLRGRMLAGTTESRWRHPDTRSTYRTPIRAPRRVAATVAPVAVAATPALTTAPAITVAAPTPPPAPKILDDYQGTKLSYKNTTPGSRIGKGSFGDVFKATWKIGTIPVVIKTVTKAKNSSTKEKDDEKNTRLFLAEANALAKTDSHYIVKFYGAYEDEPSGIPAMVLEFVSGGDLLELLKVRSPCWDTKKIMANDLVRAVKYLHEQKIVHRDIKPENLLVDPNMRLKLCDFGFAAIISADNRPKDFVGSPHYAAPEFLAGTENLSEADLYACDMYSVGATLYILITRRPTPEPAMLKNDFKGRALFNYDDDKLNAALNKGDGTACPTDALFLKKAVKDCSKHSTALRPTASTLIARFDASMPAPPPPAPAPQLVM